MGAPLQVEPEGLGNSASGTFRAGRLCVTLAQVTVCGPWQQEIGLLGALCISPLRGEGPGGERFCLDFSLSVKKRVIKKLNTCRRKGRRAMPFHTSQPPAPLFLRAPVLVLKPPVPYLEALELWAEAIWEM